MTWRERLITERDNYAQALANQTIYPGMNWPQSQQHYLDRIEQINRILASATEHDLADVLPTGRVTRAVP
jgi:hypothetical protein